MSPEIRKPKYTPWFGVKGPELSTRHEPTPPIVRVIDIPVEQQLRRRRRLNPKRTRKPQEEAKHLTPFGEYLATLRARTKLSQRELGRISGIDHSLISSIETGRNIPHISLASALAKALELDLNPTGSANLIIYLSKQEDRDYARGLFGLNEESHIFTPDPNVFIAEGTPWEKIAEYMRKQKRINAQIAKKGGMNRSTIGRAVLEKPDLLAYSFIRWVKGLDLKPEQAIDLFYSFARKTEAPKG